MNCAVMRLGGTWETGDKTEAQERRRWSWQHHPLLAKVHLAPTLTQTLSCSTPSGVCRMCCLLTSLSNFFTLIVPYRHNVAAVGHQWPDISSWLDAPGLGCCSGAAASASRSGRDGGVICC